MNKLNFSYPLKPWWRIILISSFSLLAIIYTLNQYYYPRRVCSGEVTKKLNWTSGDTVDNKILIDEKTSLAISLMFKRGAIYIDDERFPLYKEFSDKESFAKRTESGYVGYYSASGLLDKKSIFNFRFNELASVLYTENTLSGKHIYEGKIGDGSLKIVFVGNCSRKLI